MRYKRSVFPAKSLRFVFLLLAGRNNLSVAEYLLNLLVKFCSECFAM